MIKLVSLIGLFVIVQLKANRLLQQALTTKCCDPGTQPGSNGNPICFEGYICCAETGEWSCSIGDAKQYPCGGKTVDITQNPEAVGKACLDCQLPADVGLCDAIVPRYFYNKDTAECESFNWGGCGGNTNNFESLADCQKSCICSLPAETGRCRGSFPRYFYNQLTQQCEKFTYGGCGGNANNYETLAECQKTCGQTCDDANKEYKSCGTACPITCDKPGPTLCTQQCVQGCFCKEGLVLDANDKCVKADECPNQCDDANKEYKSCGTACPATCDKPGPSICTLQCVQGCFCKEGLVLDANGKCIKADECPNQCDDVNKEYTLCGSACPAKCGDQGPKACTLQCVPGCFCKKGLVLDSNGKCVKPDDCVGCGINHCISYNDGCNDCFCGDNGLARCTKKFCSALLEGPAYCTGCEEGYYLNGNNECEAKTYCRQNKECDLPAIKCRPDPFCSYNTCNDDRNVCVDYDKNGKCSSDADCDTKNGYRCVANKVCAKYM